MKLLIGIASTTHVDLHREKMAKEALDDMALQINTRFIPSLFDHDPKQQIGMLFCGKVFQLSDGEFGLYTVTGIFEHDADKNAYTIGTENTVCYDYLPMLDIKNININPVGSAVQIAEPDSSLSGLMERYMNSTAIWTDGEVYSIKHFIVAVGDLQIIVYPKDHAPAHFHVLSKQRKIDAKFSLDTLDLINDKGNKISLSDVKKIKSFFKRFPEKLENLKKEHQRLQ